MTGPEHYREAERLRDQAWDRDVTESRRTALLADAQVHATLAHHRYSSFWSAMTGRDKPLRKVTTDDGIDLWEVRAGSTSGNNGKPFRNRIFQGDPR